MEIIDLLLPIYVVRKHFDNIKKRKDVDKHEIKIFKRYPWK